MNSLLFCLLTLVNPSNDDSICRERFYEAAVKDTSTWSPFLMFEVLDDGGVRKTILLQSSSVFEERKATGESFEMFKVFMKELLRQRRPLTENEFKRYGGSVFKSDRYVNRIAKKGKKKFIRHFFRGGVFNNLKYGDHEMAVYAKMFDFEALVAIVDNGNFGIVYNSDCK